MLHDLYTLTRRRISIHPTAPMTVVAHSIWTLVSTIYISTTVDLSSLRIVLTCFGCYQSVFMDGILNSLRAVRMDVTSR